MVRNHQRPMITIDTNEALMLRGQADRLLQHLLERRVSSEKRLAETGQRDAIKAVTGRTAMEDAIATTQVMIRDMDELLEAMNGELAAAQSTNGICGSGNGQ